MSIIIKGMDMPKNCFQCSFNDGIYCCLNDTEALIPKMPTDRLKGCPLIEIPDSIIEQELPRLERLTKEVKGNRWLYEHTD